MRWGVFSRALWGLDTVVLGLALSLLPFLDTPEASLTSTFLHDAICMVILFAYMALRGRLKNTLAAIKARSDKAIALGALLGGPFGMASYLIAINNIGPGFTAVISTSYPAIGTFLAYIFLEERMHPRQILALLVALGAIILIGYSSIGVTNEDNPIIGVITALACVLDWGSEAVVLAQGMKDDGVDENSTLQIRETTSTLVYLAVVGPITGVIGFTFTATPTPATGIITLATLAGTCSYLSYYEAIDAVDASRGMALNISYSTWAVIFAFLIMGTAPTLLQVVCCLVILVGTALAATPNRRGLHSGWRETRTSLKSS